MTSNHPTPRRVGHGTVPLSLLVLVIAAFLVAGCDDGSGSAGTSRAGSSVPSRGEGGTGLEGTITVSAATSLTDAFEEIGERFTSANPGAEVSFNFDASSALATQIVEGAPVDVFASADEANMAELTDRALLSGSPTIFARNELVIVTKPGNPESISSLADLADAGVISLCGEEAPCGRYAAEVLAHAGVTVDESNVTRGQNVRATLTAVATGDAVAGIVYLTDAAAAGDAVETVVIPIELDVVALYPIGVLAASADVEVAEAFRAFVVGEEGRAVLAEHGFLPPP